MIECRVPKTKVITTANHKKGNISRRPIRTRSKKCGKKVREIKVQGKKGCENSVGKKSEEKVQENAGDQSCGDWL